MIKLIGSALVISSLCSCTSQMVVSGQANERTPLLGLPWGMWSKTQKGYGTVRPTTVFNGGDPTGLIEEIKWRYWGHAIAIGSGYGYFPTKAQGVASARRQRATIVAFGLGSCNGVYVYNKVSVVVGTSRNFNRNFYINICTGSYVGTS